MPSRSHMYTVVCSRIQSYTVVCSRIQSHAEKGQHSCHIGHARATGLRQPPDSAGPPSVEMKGQTPAMETDPRDGNLGVAPDNPPRWKSRVAIPPVGNRRDINHVRRGIRIDIFRQRLRQGQQFRRAGG